MYYFVSAEALENQIVYKCEEQKDATDDPLWWIFSCHFYNKTWSWRRISDSPIISRMINRGAYYSTLEELIRDPTMSETLRHSLLLEEI